MSLLTFSDNKYFSKKKFPLPELDHSFVLKGSVITTKTPFKTEVYVCKKCFLVFEFSYSLISLERGIKEAKIPPCGSKDIDIAKVYKRPGIIEERKTFDVENPDYWDNNCEITDEDYRSIMRFMTGWTEKEMDDLPIYSRDKSYKEGKKKLKLECVFNE